MQQRNKIPVLDFYHDRVSMALWPKFTSMFQLYIESVQRAQPKSFRVYSAAGVHSATAKYVNFISGVYRLADCCTSGQDMILPRLTLLKQQMSNLIERLASEHFGQAENSQKMPIVFLINNLYFIVTQLQMLNLQKGAKDMVMFDRMLQQKIAKYLETLLQTNFVGLHQIVNEFSSEPDDSGEDTSGDMSIGGGTKLRDLQNVNKKNLEVVAQDFSFSYKQKAELMSREIQQDLT